MSSTWQAPVLVRVQRGDGTWAADAPDFPGCVAIGDDAGQAVERCLALVHFRQGRFWAGVEATARPHLRTAGWILTGAVWMWLYLIAAIAY
jgi:hypothetical protein